MSGPVRVGIIGMGFMGQTHARAYSWAAINGAPCTLAAVCDRDPSRRSGLASAAGNIQTGGSDERLFDPAVVTGYADPGSLLADKSIDLVSVCTHTDSHVEVALRALERGKHVLVEKPVAVRSSEVRRLLDAARASDRLCVPAMCIRHWPGWSDLSSLIHRGTHGRVVHARFERLGAAPAWAGNFYTDPDRCGGAVFDLHIHDADLAVSLFGLPDRVSSMGDAHHITTQMHYPGGPAVNTEGGWLNGRGFPFRMSFTVEFEHAVVSFDSSRTPRMMLHAEGRSEEIPLPPHTGYDAQARSVVRAVTRPELRSALPTLADALDVTRLIEAERHSAASGQPVTLDPTV